MGAIATSLDGQFIYMAIEDQSTGNQMIVRANRDALGLWTTVYDPGGGSAANVAATGDKNKMLFYGNFGTDVTVILHEIEPVTNTDISPASLGAKVVNTLAVNIDRIVITVNTDQDILATEDGGSNWSSWNSALGSDPTALALIWAGAYDLNRFFVCGHNGTDLDVLYSPSEANAINLEDATLGALTNICSVDVVKSQ